MSEDIVLRSVTIYFRPRDMPGVNYAVRSFTVRNGGVPAEPGPLLGFAETLEKARLLVPPECDVRLPRDQGDDPVVVETWI